MSLQPRVQQWTVLSRPECGLCEEFVSELQQLLVAYSAGGGVIPQVEIADVDTNLDWSRKYGERIPVLLANDDYVCAIRLDVERVRRLLSSPL
jgi:hypothetical protein